MDRGKNCKLSSDFYLQMESHYLPEEPRPGLSCGSLRIVLDLQVAFQLVRRMVIGRASKKEDGIKLNK